MPQCRARPQRRIHSLAPTRLRLALLASLAFPALLTGCGERSNPAASPAPATTAGLPVAVTEAIRQDVEVVRRSVGTVRAIEMVNLASEVEGLIEQIAFQESARVEQGQVLVRLNARQADAELEAARARRDRIALQFDSLEHLHQRGAATNKEYQDIRSEVTEAEAQLRLAEIRLDQHTIRAPFDGQVGLRQQSVGAWIRAGDPLTTLIATDPIEVRFQLPEQALAEIAAEQRVVLRSPAYPDHALTGEVVTIDSVVDPQTRSITVVAHLPNGQGRLKPGMFTEVTLVTAVRPNAVVVPETALATRGSETTLFIVEDGLAQRRRVTVGQRRGGQVEIRAGLDAGQVVITSDPEQLRDGLAVAPHPDTTLSALGLAPAGPANAVAP